jgi:23S rRNA (adenine-N6)-dimethyltransferase
VPGRSRSGRRRGSDLGQHFLESAALASRIVADVGALPSDLVVEFGAGTGVLTTALAASGTRVLAVEVDGRLAGRLALRFAGHGAVTVFECDALEFPLPSSPYRVVANPPFNRTSAMLHRLLDHPEGGLARADLVVQWQVARARAIAGARAPLDLVGASWAPWWTFRRARRLPAALFRPAPSVDAAILSITRRATPLLPVTDATRYLAFVRARFGPTSPTSAEGWVRRFTHDVDVGGETAPRHAGGG